MNNTVTYNDVEGEDLGGGVVLFRSAINFDPDYAFDLCNEIVSREKAAMYTLGQDPETGEEIYINRSGYFFDKNSIDIMPGRGSAAHQDPREEVVEFLNGLESSRDKYLFKYLEAYPLAFKCIWWKVKGHIVAYKKNAYLGSHSDISTDYIYGVWTPTDQLAMRSTVTALIYFNDSVESQDQLNGKNFIGGDHYFNYLDITHKPKKGDVIFFPASYTAGHEVKIVEDGLRFSYLGWYSQGTPNGEVKESVSDPVTEPQVAQSATNVYMPTFIKDYQNHLLNRGYDEFSEQYRITVSSYGK
jgi:predicted 2-oxoglutarate/Fe(II)-dependent dioxygenase YbiX